MDRSRWPLIRTSATFSRGRRSVAAVEGPSFEASRHGYGGPVVRPAATCSGGGSFLAGGGQGIGTSANSKGMSTSVRASE